MALAAVPRPDYAGAQGALHVRQLRQELVCALQAEDWPRVRQLDRACASLLERVIAANGEGAGALVLALSELKGVYASLIDRCYQQAPQMAL